MRNLITGKQIKQARTLLNVTQDQLAFKCHKFLNQTTISKMENGKDVPQYIYRRLQKYFERNGIGFSRDGETIFTILQPIDCVNARQSENTANSKQKFSTGKKAPKLFDFLIFPKNVIRINFRPQGT